MPYRFLILLALYGLMSGVAAYAKTPSLAVVYPEVREPYRSVFQEIIRGMEAELGRKVTRYVLNNPQDSADNLLVQMKKDRIDTVVTLGRAGYAVAESLAKEFPVVVGAVLLTPGQNSANLSGISLAPDPEILFARLKELVPAARDITVVYDPEQKTEEISRASNAAQTRGMSLHALQADSLQRSAAIYQGVLREIKDDSAAIWLLQNNRAMDDRTLLPLVLEKAWDRRFVLFSDSLAHVRKGALFSLYPDNFGMGRRLAVLARNRSEGGTAHDATIEPLRSLLTAVNLRTAEHLGLRFSNDAVRKFGITFPPRQ